MTWHDLLEDLGATAEQRLKRAAERYGVPSTHEALKILDWRLPDHTPTTALADTTATTPLQATTTACRDCTEYREHVLAWAKGRSADDITAPHPTWDDIGQTMFISGEGLRRRLRTWRTLVRRPARCKVRMREATKRSSDAASG